MNRITLLFAAVFLLCGCATNPAPTVTSVNVSGLPAVIASMVIKVNFTGTIRKKKRKEQDKGK